MRRTIRFSAGPDEFQQGFARENIAVSLLMLAGDDSALLDRDDDSGGRNTVDAGAGNDSVINQSEQGNDIRLGGGNDTYVGLGFGSFSTDAPDTVRGGDGNDTFAVSTFKSSYLGEAGNDQFFSVGWQNSFDGGAGRDTISYKPRDDDSTLGGSGVTVDLSEGLAQTGGSRFEKLRQIENVIGTRNHDALFGDAKSNRLNGRSGDDVLAGGAGVDSLTGGGGRDRFILDAPSSADSITDFRSGTDKLLIRQSDIRIGNGDSFINGALSRNKPGGFATTSELVIFTANISGTITNARAATTIGSAQAAYTVGERRLFAVDNGTSSALFLFSAANADSRVAAAELTRLATLSSTPTLARADLLLLA